MKKLFILLMLFVGPVLFAQEVWPQKSVTLGEQARAECFRLEYNIGRCETAGLKAGCDPFAR